MSPARINQVVSAPASSVPLSAFCEGFNRAFSDYKYAMSFDTTSFADFLERSGILADDSVIARIDEESVPRVVGVALIARHGKAAWCGGLAVDPAFRRQGWARQLMSTAEARLRSLGSEQIRLEVLTENEPARRLYRQLGYQEERELLIWERPAYQGALPLPYEQLEEADPGQVLTDFHIWHDLQPSWQRRDFFLGRNLSRLQAVTISAMDDAPVAYALFRRTPGEHEGEEKVYIADIAVDPAADVLMAGRPLMQALQLRFLDATLVLVNEPADSKLSRILAALGFYVTDRQIELVRPLDPLST